MKMIGGQMIDFLTVCVIYHLNKILITVNSGFCKQNTLFTMNSQNILYDRLDPWGYVLMESVMGYA